MRSSTRQWVRVKDLKAEEKAEIGAACQQLIDTFLKPHFLPVIRPTSFNYPVDIFGKWRGTRYSFITRYRSGFPENLGEEFDAAFTRLDFQEGKSTGPIFDVMWHRHTGQWLALHRGVTLQEALDLVRTDGLLQPAL
ncbi:hypothetical protein [Rhizobium sp. CSW-27]|uniref:DUF3024 domain-containing protein n=1 Tax=Rhizobium sp. CSW-27 TaxID=2839985 RepID=UPI001C0155D6|nr:hypothetical protein [Rhizobium sp. CSW-27]MBT9372209.1 hypothetical protein [Rhizobium sp. CSW-27]